MNALKKIHQFAKQYKKLHPKKAWKDCIAAGSKKYNASKKVGSTLILQKGETKKKNKVRSVLLQRRTTKGTFDGYKKISGAIDRQRWLILFAPRSKSWQRSTYQKIKKELNTGKINIFTTESERKEQLVALEILLGKRNSF